MLERGTLGDTVKNMQGRGSIEGGRDIERDCGQSYALALMTDSLLSQNLNTPNGP